jgi:hypothetical protein
MFRSQASSQVFTADGYLRPMLLSAKATMAVSASVSVAAV